MDTPDAFMIAFNATIGHEGDTLDLDPQDRGNWTSGRVGVGELRGSKYGIAAAFHPDVDIASLTRAEAEAIYRREYWAPIRGDALPGPLAVMVLDAAINCGVGAAARLVQQAVGVFEDGVIGAMTLNGVRTACMTRGLDSVCSEFLARRIVYEAATPAFRRDTLGLARRLSAQPYDAMKAAA
jgi:lysozyme family protein